MQNTKIGNTIPRNPWHGCKRVSPGCKNCFVYKIEFHFHQCGSLFLRDGVKIGKWNPNQPIRRVEEIRHELENTDW